MNLVCIRCRQPFTLENINVAKYDIVCPVTDCGNVSSLDSLMEFRYGTEVGIRVRVIQTLVDGKRGPCDLKTLSTLNWRVEEFARQFEREEKGYAVRD